VRRSCSSPPSHRQSATEAPASLRFSTRQEPPALSQRRRRARGGVDAAAIGAAATALGAGRHRKGAPIDPAVGIVLTTRVGDTVRRGEVIGEVHARSEDAAQLARAAVLAAVRLSDAPVPEPPLIAATLGEEPVG